MSSSKLIEIIIADDHTLFRNGLSQMLKSDPCFNVIAEAEDGKELIDLVRKHAPDVVLTDVLMPVMSGVEAVRIISHDFEQIAILALSMSDEELTIMQMLEAGATGYLLKNAENHEIIEAIKVASSHKPYYCKKTFAKLSRAIYQKSIKETKPKVEFSEKEIEIIKCICEEFTNKEIGKQLFLSKRTVDGYRSKIMEKIQAKSTAGVVIYAIQNGFYNIFDNKIY